MERRCVSLLGLLAVWFCLASVSHGVMVENSFVVSRHVGEESVSITGHDAAPCGSAAAEVCAGVEFGVDWWSLECC